MMNAYRRTNNKLTIPPFLKNLTGIQIGMIVGLLLFEVFNFDTSKFALETLLGNQAFAGIPWSGILAVAFCAIDSLSLIQLFGPEEEGDLKDWLLVGVWLIGASLNACLTWWTISIILLTQEIGNEVLSREELLLFAPIIIAILVLLTRITLIGTLAFAKSSTTSHSKPKSNVSRPVQSQRNTPPRRQTIRVTQPTLGDRDDPDVDYLPSENGYGGH